MPKRYLCSLLHQEHHHLTGKCERNISPELTSSEKLTAATAFASLASPLSIRQPDFPPFNPNFKTPEEKPVEQPVMNYSNYSELIVSKLSS